MRFYWINTIVSLLAVEKNITFAQPCNKCTATIFSRLDDVCVLHKNLLGFFHRLNATIFHIANWKKQSTTNIIMFEQFMTVLKLIASRLEFNLIIVCFFISQCRPSRLNFDLFSKGSDFYSLNLSI